MVRFLDLQVRRSQLPLVIRKRLPPLFEWWSKCFVSQGKTPSERNLWKADRMLGGDEKVEIARWTQANRRDTVRQNQIEL